MLNFFRRIRRKLAGDNKPLKYARYAIGEIVLVVIGILIALQVNNWNEDKKIEVLEKQFLQGLINDLKRDSIFLSDKIRAYNITIKNNSDYLIEAYEVQNTYEEYVEVVSLINWDSENLTIQNATYTELSNLGRLNIFQNIELKTNIISHYRNYDQVSKHIFEFNNFTANFLANNMPVGHSIFLQLYKPSEVILKRPEQWGWINNISSERFLFNIESAAMYASKHTVFVEYYKDLLEKGNLLIQAINKELRMRFK